jgi:hypothetical protein
MAAAQGSTAVALQRRRNDVEVPAAPIRHETDNAANAVARFCEVHPEYARLAPEIVEQAMATYLTEDEHRVRKLLADEGVPVGRRAGAWSDEA